MTMIFAEVIDYAERHGVARIDKLPGCWEVQVDSRWWFALNPHNTEIECSHYGHKVQPMTLYVEYNGWPAGVVTLHGGEFAAGEAANQDTFIEALRMA